MPAKFRFLTSVFSASVLAVPAVAESLVEVRQAGGGASAFVTQVPETARQIQPINRGQGNSGAQAQARADAQAQAQAQARAQAQAEAQARAEAARLRRDFILDFEGQRPQNSLPSVREGVRVAAQ